MGDGLRLGCQNLAELRACLGGWQGSWPGLFVWTSGDKSVGCDEIPPDSLEESLHAEALSSEEKEPGESFLAAESTLRPLFHFCSIAVFIFLAGFTVVLNDEMEIKSSYNHQRSNIIWKHYIGIRT